MEVPHRWPTGIGFGAYRSIGTATLRTCGTAKLNPARSATLSRCATGATSWSRTFFCGTNSMSCSVPILAPTSRPETGFSGCWSGEGERLPRAVGRNCAQGGAQPSTRISGHASWSVCCWSSSTTITRLAHIKASASGGQFGVRRARARPTTQKSSESIASVVPFISTLGQRDAGRRTMG